MSYVYPLTIANGVLYTHGMTTINRQLVKAYYRKWASSNYSNQTAIDFTEMLQKKTIFALSTGSSVWAYDKKYTGKELETMYCIAEDLFCEYPNLRGGENINDQRRKKTSH